MRLQSYLNEKFFDAMKHNGDIFEIFVNPSKKELKEVIAFSGHGYRFFIDFKKKNFYAWSDVLFHEPAMGKIKELDSSIPTFHAYWYKFKGSGDYFTGSSTGREVYSDYIQTVEDMQTGQQYLDHDWSFLKRYLSPSEFQDLYNMIEEQIA
jgi:hypothetical protein